MLTTKVQGDGLGRMIEGLDALSDQQGHDVLRRALNRTGRTAFKVVKKVLAKQVGTTQATLLEDGALKTVSANYRSLEFQIISTGKHLPLRAFGAEQKKKGVSAQPWGKRRIFRGTFIVKSRGGNVYKRLTRQSLPIKKLWGPAIPRELVKGQSAAAFEAVASRFDKRVEHEIKAITRGIVS